MKVLIVGLGIGKVYEEELLKKGDLVETLDPDPSKKPTYQEISQLSTNKFDIAIICSPNHTHEYYLKRLTDITNTIVVEKPGLSSVNLWEKYVESYKNHKIILAKNNLYRPQLKLLKDSLIAWERVDSINFIWENKHRIPQPGGWFTNKEKSWGGVGQDLFPHLINMSYALLGFLNLKDIKITKKQNFNLDHLVKHLTTNDYGNINIHGIYNVEDFCELNTVHKGVNITMKSNWINEVNDVRKIEINFKDSTSIDFNFGLCPNHLYGDMIDDYIKLDRYSYQKHIDIDLYTHTLLDKLKE